MNDPTHAGDGFDSRLETLFRREHTRIPAEPFVGATKKRIAAERSRENLIQRLVQAAVLVVVIVASPWLIDASVLASAALEEVFALVSAWLETTPGATIVAILFGAVLLTLLRLRVRR